MVKVQKSYEFWKSVPGYEGFYEISIICLRNIETGKIRKPVKMKIGYLFFGLYKNGISSGGYLHRILASCFIFNKHPERRFIDHKDGNKLNNALPNIEWVTQAENNRRAYATGLKNGDHKRLEVRGKHACAKKVGKILNGELVESFDCKIDAQEKSNRSVGYFIKNRRADPDGFNWKYL